MTHDKIVIVLYLSVLIGYHGNVHTIPSSTVALHRSRQWQLSALSYPCPAFTAQVLRNKTESRVHVNT